MNTAQLVHDISGSYDAFSRLRISEPYSIFDCKLLYDSQPILWDDKQVSGSNTDSVHSSNESCVTLSVSSNQAGYRVRQTYQRFAYQPGKSQLVMMTGVIGSYSNDIIKRIGCFDSNNGLFFQSGPDDYYIGKRSSTSGTPVDIIIPQRLWNKNKLDAPDLIYLDFNKANIFYFNYEWLGVGDICCGVVIGKKYIQLHQFFYANENTTVSFSKPNLPLRYEIQNIGNGLESSLKCICTSVMSEGGQTGTGYLYTLDRGSTALTIAASGTIYPLITIRLKEERESAAVYIEGINIITTTANTIFRWMLFLNPLLNGTELNFTTSPISTSIEYNATNNNGTTISEGILLRSGYGIGTNATILSDNIAAKLSLGTSINNVSDVVVLAIQRLDNQNNTFYASMTLRESV
jgi:hypothetical protein